MMTTYGQQNQHKRNQQNPLATQRLVHSTGGGARVRRSRRMNAEPRLQCELCFKEHGKKHPCLFCDECLQKCRGEEERASSSSSEYRHYGRFLGGREDIKFMDGHTVNTLGNPSAFLQGYAASKSVTSSGAPTDKTASLRRYKTQERMKSIQEDLFGKMEKKTIRCGLCPEWEKRRPIARFCYHCKKRLCDRCSVYHEEDPLTAFHASVDMTESNSALL